MLLLCATHAACSAGWSASERPGAFTLGVFQLMENRRASRPWQNLSCDGRLIERRALLAELVPNRDDAVVYGRYGSHVAECMPSWDLGIFGSTQADEAVEYGEDCAAVFVYDAASRSKRRLVAGMYPHPGTSSYPVVYAWSPAGDRLLSHSLFGDPIVLFLDGRSAIHVTEPLTPRPFTEMRFEGWLPDGQRLLLTAHDSLAFEEPVRHHLVVVRPGESKWSYVATKICPTDGSCWSRDDYGWDRQGMPLPRTDLDDIQIEPDAGAVPE